MIDSLKWQLIVQNDSLKLPLTVQNENGHFINNMNKT